jgi:pimeloyl-ACP methyl ester carboxylesterase
LIGNTFGKSVGSTNRSNILVGLWQNRWLGATAALAVGALAGFVAAWGMPLGPATTTQALISVGLGLVAGLAAGLLMGSRWALLVAPLGYLLAFELMHWGSPVTSLGPIRLDEMYGILALILGRGFHGLLALLPMVLAGELGVRWARSLAGQPAWPTRTAGWIPVGLAVLALVALIVALLWPARTPAIVGQDGQPLPGSVAEMVSVPVNGSNQTLLIRGQSVENPVLLYLAGGPGQSSLPHPRVLFADIERDFTVVAWDQRGTGKSYAALNPATLSPEEAVADLVDVTNYLRERFDEEKIYLLGESYGTLLAVLAAQERPDLFHAIISSGQMVSVQETDRRLYWQVMETAQANGDTQLVAQLEAFGEPPYSDTPYPNAFMMGLYEQFYEPYSPPMNYQQRGTAANLGFFGINGSEYNPVEKVNVLRGLIDMFSLMYPQLQTLDLRESAAQIDVPLYILDGTSELAARRDLALEWFEQVDAPIKRLYPLDDAAHSVAFEQYEAFHRILLEDVLPETYGG